MKKLFAIIGLLCLPMLASCGQPIKSDEVGVLVKEMGAGAGVQQTELKTGRHWTGIGEYIIKFPTRTRIEVWGAGDTANQTPDSRDDVDGPALTFLNKDNVQTWIGVTVSLSVDPSKASDLVQKYRWGFDEITNRVVKKNIQEAYIRLGRGFTAEQLISGSDVTLTSQVLADIKPRLAIEGINVENIEVFNAALLDKNMMDNIKNKIRADQEAATATAQVKIVEARAQQRIAEAKGRADALSVEGEALRKNPEVLKLREIEKSQGICPMSAQTCVVGPIPGLQLH